MTEYTHIYVSKTLKWDVSLYLTGTTCFKLILQYLFLCTEKLALCVCVYIYIYIYKIWLEILKQLFFKASQCEFFF